MSESGFAFFAIWRMPLMMEFIKLIQLRVKLKLIPVKEPFKILMAAAIKRTNY